MAGWSWQCQFPVSLVWHSSVANSIRGRVRGQTKSCLQITNYNFFYDHPHFTIAIIKLRCTEYCSHLQQPLPAWSPHSNTHHPVLWVEVGERAVLPEEEEVAAEESSLPSSTKFDPPGKTRVIAQAQRTQKLDHSIIPWPQVTTFFSVFLLLI